MLMCVWFSPSALPLAVSSLPANSRRVYLNESSPAQDFFLLGSKRGFPCHRCIVASSGTKLQVSE